MTEKATELASGIEELIDLANDEVREINELVEQLDIREEFFEGLSCAIYFADESFPDGRLEKFGEEREKFEKLCKAMPDVPRQCLELTGYAMAEIVIFFRNLEKGELTIGSGARHLMTTSLARGAASTLLPASVEALIVKAQAKRNAALSEAGRQGATVRNRPYQGFKEWVFAEASNMRDAQRDIARKLAARLPAQFADVSRSPERLIYDALRSSAKPN